MELGKMKIVKGKVQEIWGKFETRMRETMEKIEKNRRGERGRRKEWDEECRKKKGRLKES